MLSRNWRCLNPACGKEFHSYERGNPECTFCRCVKVAWIPGGGHIGAKAPGIDKTLRALAADYGLSNLNSVSPSRQAQAKVMPAAPAAGSYGTKQWAPGFSSEVYANPHCQSSSTPINLRGFQPVGRVMPRSGSIATPGLRDGLMTRVEGVHRPGPRGGT